jgi:hypothetical protein
MKALIGTVGLASVEVAQQLPTDGTPTSEVIKIVVQLVIGLATLIGLFKKPKTPKT